MRRFSIEEIAKVIKGKVIYWNHDRKMERFVEQPDRPIKNCLYFLLEGCDDEDKLLSRLVKYKAAGIVIRAPHELNINKWRNANIGVIEVKRMTKAYLAVAKFYRSQFNIPFIEVIGSSGKTTTKEMIGHVLNGGIEAFAGYENYNAPSGVAYNIFQIEEKHKAAVLEVGMKSFGIMDMSSDMVKPNIGVVTSIHRAHFCSLGSIENIIKAKAEILDHLASDGTLIINGEDENCNRLPLHKFKGEILRFGFSDQFDIWASDIRCKGLKTYFTANGKDFEINCVINTFGKYNVANALASIMVGIKLGIGHKNIVKGLAHFNPVSRRQQICKGINHSTIINDNFNANVDSTKLLLEELPSFTKNRPVILVFGDMERPSDEAEEYAREGHFRIGKEIAKLKFHHLIAVGKWAEEYINGAISKGVSKEKLSYFEHVHDAKKKLLEVSIPNSVIVFKASIAYVNLKELIELVKITKG